MSNIKRILENLGIELETSEVDINIMGDMNEGSLIAGMLASILNDRANNKCATCSNKQVCDGIIDKVKAGIYEKVADLAEPARAEVGRIKEAKSKLEVLREEAKAKMDVLQKAGEEAEEATHIYEKAKARLQEEHSDMWDDIMIFHKVKKADYIALRINTLEGTLEGIKIR